MTKAKAIIRLLRPHELFLLIPLNLAMLLLAAGPSSLDIRKAILFLCTISAGYMAGDAVNGLSDSHIDSLNPRTLKRPLASGAISTWEGLAAAAACVIVVVVCTYFIKPFYVLLLPIPVGIEIIYCLSKRVTSFCHFLMGIAAAVSPFAAWIVFSEWRDIRAFLCGAIVFFHVSAYDLLYSIQDMEYDRKSGMHSIPAEYGKRTAMVIAALCDFVMYVLLIFLSRIMHLGIYFNIGMGIMVILTVVQFALVEKEKGRFAFGLNFVYDVIFMTFIIFERIF